MKRQPRVSTRNSRLSNLPEDILRLILQRLDPPELLRLGRLSRLFNRLTNQALESVFAKTNHKLFLHRYLPTPAKHAEPTSLEKLVNMLEKYASPERGQYLHPAHAIELKLMRQNPTKLSFWLRSENATWFSFIPRFLSLELNKKRTFLSQDEEAIIIQQLIEAVPYLSLPEKLEQLEPLAQVLTPAQFYPITQKILDEFCNQAPKLSQIPEQHFLPQDTNAAMLEKLDLCFSQILLEKGRHFCESVEIKKRDISYNKMKKLLKNPSITIKEFIEGIYVHTTLFSRLKNVRDLFKKVLEHPHKSLIQYLLVSGMNIFTPTENVPASTYAHMTAATRSPSVVREVLSRPFSLKLVVDFIDECWNTPLHAATEHGNRKTVVFLVEQGSDPLAKNRAGQSALDLASPQSKEQILDLMRQRFLVFSPLSPLDDTSTSPRVSRAETPTWEMGKTRRSLNSTPTPQ